jgi:hypothetical protein
MHNNTIQYIPTYINTYINTHTHTHGGKVMKISCVNFKELLPSTKYFCIIHWSRRREVSFQLKKKKKKKKRGAKGSTTFFKKPGGTINQCHLGP